MSRPSSADLDPHDITIAGDRGKVLEILDSLLYDALKFTPPHIRLGLRFSTCKRLMEVREVNIRFDSAPREGTLVYFSHMVA